MFSLTGTRGKNHMQKKQQNLISVFLFLLCLTIGAGKLPGEVKIVYIPEKVEVEENATIETRVKNLSEQEIYQKGHIQIIDNFIYYRYDKRTELIKLDLQGNVIDRLRKYGVGPGEFVDFTGFGILHGDLGLIDTVKMKFLVYTKDLKFSWEKRMNYVFFGFYENNKKEIVFTDRSGGYADYYFYVYSGDMNKQLRKFGKTITTPADIKKKHLFDAVRTVLYLPEKDGVWASFKNRYDLRYYENERLAVEIRGPKGFFRAEENVMAGRKVIFPLDRSFHLARVGNQLFYFYSKDKATYCDIFDLGILELLRRVKFRFYYATCITHWKDNVFYGLVSDKQSPDEDVLLYRIELKNFIFDINKSR